MLKKRKTIDSYFNKGPSSASVIHKNDIEIGDAVVDSDIVQSIDIDATVVIDASNSNFPRSQVMNENVDNDSIVRDLGLRKQIDSYLVNRQDEI